MLKDVLPIIDTDDSVGGVNGGNGGVNDDNSGLNGRVNGENGRVNEENGRVNGRVKSLISKKGGITTSEMLEEMPELTLRTLGRIIKELKEANIIEFKGAPKTGGYYLIDKK